MNALMPLRILFTGFSNKGAWRRRWERIVAAAPAGLRVSMVWIDLPEPHSKAPWPRLDRLYRRRDRALMSLYERVAAAAAECDVLLQYSNWNLHPDFLRSLPTFNAFCAWDDPESSAKLTRPVAPAADAAFCGNIASLTQYRDWGCPRVAHLPIFVDPGSVPPREQAESLLSGVRDSDVILCCGRTRWRQQRVRGLVAAFPQAKLFGRGWGSGYIAQETLDDLYRRSRIGWNIHNSTGPINERLFALAAWGIMPLCDNRAGLAELFDLDREAVGFDTIPQAIERTRYYLAHDDERAAIAAAAYRRYWRDYDATANWMRIERQLRAWMADRTWRDKRRDDREWLADLADAPDAIVLKARWRQKLSTTYERLRYGQARRDLDERFYAGIDVPFRVRGKVTSAAAARGLAPVGRVDDDNHLLAAAWAASALIGSAVRIAVYGPGAGDFARLAERQSPRQVMVMDRLETAGRADLLVVLHVDDASLERVRKAAAASQRLVIVYRPEAGQSRRAVARFARHLDGWTADLRLFCLHDPMVPWLTPLEGPAPVSPAIAACAAR